ncbi:uncharacterized protein RHO25_006960 [Cercospora beticola]|uniref:Uncharacterized protein n=1 Tax=Cercospora beticola TaxID=122368 RepID=A0ABZ0NS24_CERBT|nr:hypothetical protein RHO25_006960 [Cercospora beticola]
MSSGADVAGAAEYTGTRELEKTLALREEGTGEANECFIEAQSVWQIVWRYHPVGEDEAVDASLEELRASLDKLKEALAADKPTVPDPDTAVVDQDTVRDAAVDEEKASNEHVNETALFMVQTPPPECSLRIEIPAPTQGSGGAGGFSFSGHGSHAGIRSDGRSMSHDAIIPIARALTISFRFAAVTSSLSKPRRP